MSLEHFVPENKCSKNDRDVGHRAQLEKTPRAKFGTN